MRRDKCEGSKGCRKQSVASCKQCRGHICQVHAIGRQGNEATCPKCAKAAARKRRAA